MSSLSRLLVFSRHVRQKTRFFFLLVAIATASCLVVWTMGGYQALYVEMTQSDERPLGRYDVKIGENLADGPGITTRRSGGGGGGFSGPLAQRPAGGGADGTRKGMNGPDGPKNDNSKSTKDRFDPLQSARVRDGSIVLERIPATIPDHIRERLVKADADGNGVLSRMEERSFYSISEGKSDSDDKPKRGDRNPVIASSFIDAIRNDPDVRSVDSMRTVRAFVFAEKKEEKSKEEESPDSDVAYEETVPAGIDPKLHRRALTAYRAGMGTPMSLGETFLGIDAVDPPTDLEEGRWFSNDVAREAVLGKEAARRFGAKPNDRLLILTKTEEFQLTVVGILDDPYLTGFYVPIKIADAIADTPPTVNSLGIALTHSASPEKFKARWEERLTKEAKGAALSTATEMARQREKDFQAASSFRLQAVAGTLLAILASVMIIFTALSIGVEERRREIGLMRAVGLSGGQIADSVLTESVLLAIPGWLGGLLTGWLILGLATGKALGLNGATVGFSFLCAIVGSLVAAIVPMLTACRVRPLEAVSNVREEALARFTPGTRRMIRMGIFLVGVALILFDLGLIYGIPTDRAHRAALHSGVGIIALIGGVLCLIPTGVRLAERILLPILATFLCFDRTVSMSELSSHMKRTVGTAAMLAVGGGLFVLTQIWGYSMLAPFLPDRRMPDAFVAFLPIGLTETNVAAIRELPNVNRTEFEPVMVEQAAFAPDSIPNGKGGDFANVVFFGMNVDRAFTGENPLVALDFIEGDATSAFEAMKNGRGVVVTDSLKVDYGYHLGGTLRVSDPKKNARILEYPIVGIVAFHGWQWLSKTGGVRRNYGRSGGMAFTSDDLIRSDYARNDASYFWFNLKKNDVTEEARLERALDALARKNLSDLVAENGANGNAAYVKLSTRRSLADSISRRADSVIWGLSAMPLVTLILMSVALVAVTVNSVQSRRRSFGIMRAVGMERSKLVRMILAESILLGLIAAGASLLFGIPAAVGALKLGQSMFGTADPKMILPVFGLSFGLGLLTFLAVIAALIPAIRIGTTPPLDLLREGRGE